jgi:hypothetical protein
MDTALIIIGCVAGYLLANLMCGDYAGDRLENSLRFQVNDYYIHIHHWLYCLVAFLVLVYFDIYHSVIYGLLLGAIVQGLTYPDRFVFFYKKSNFHDIYRRWQPEDDR